MCVYDVLPTAITEKRANKISHFIIELSQMVRILSVDFVAIEVAREWANAVH